MPDSLKQIQLKLGLDTSGIEQQVSQLKQKINRLTQTDSTLNKLGDDSSPQARAQQRVLQQAREAEVRQLKREYDRLGDATKKIDDQMKSITQEMRNQNKEQQALSKQKLDSLAIEKGEMVKTQQQVQGAIQPQQQPEQPQQQGNLVGNMSRAMLQALGGAAVVGTAIQGVIKAAEHIITRERVTAQLKGQAIAAGPGKEFQDIAGGQAGRLGYWRGERHEAFGMAAKEMERQKGLDVMKILGAMGTAGAVGAGGGFAMGGPLGAAVGGVGGAITGGIGAMFNDRLRAKVFDPEMYQGMQAKDFASNYQSNLAALQMQQPGKKLGRDFWEQEAKGLGRLQRQLGSTTDADFYGTVEDLDTSADASGSWGEPQAAVAYDEGSVGFLGPGGRGNIGGGISRTSKRGASGQWGDPDKEAKVKLEGDRDFRKFKRRGTLTGAIAMGKEYGGMEFDPEMVKQQAGSILGAGGTTAGARGLMGVSAMYQRQFGLENAGKIAGMMTGAGIDEKRTEQLMRKNMAEAITIGMDASKMAENTQEMKKFTEISAQVMSRGGGGEALGAMEVFKAGIGDFTSRGLQAAGGAFEEFRQQAKAGGGARGQIGYGALQKTASEMGVNLTSKQMNYLNQFSYADATEGDIQGIAARLGISEEEATKLLKEKDKAKQTITQESEQAFTSFGEDLGKMDASKRQEILKQYRSGKKLGDKEMRGRFTQMEELLASEKGKAFTGLDAAEKRAQVIQALGLHGGYIKGAGETEESAVDKAAKRKTDRAADWAGAEAAKGLETRVQAFLTHADKLKEGAAKMDSYVELHNQRMQAFISALKNATGDMSDVMRQWAAKLSQEGLTLTDRSGGQPLSTDTGKKKPKSSSQSDGSW